MPLPRAIRLSAAYRCFGELDRLAAALRAAGPHHHHSSPDSPFPRSGIVVMPLIYCYTATGFVDCRIVRAWSLDL
jgi:hypothetical protein